MNPKLTCYPHIFGSICIDKKRIIRIIREVTVLNIVWSSPAQCLITQIDLNHIKLPTCIHLIYIPYSMWRMHRYMFHQTITIYINYA